MDRRVFKNYLYNVSYQILIIVLPLITTPYISRVLGAKGIGIFSYTNSIIQYFILLGCIGLNLYGQREIAYCQSDMNKRSITFCELFLIRTITLSISLILFFFTFCHSNKYSDIYIIQTIDIISSIIDISWLYQGMEDFKKIVIRNIIVKVIGLILIFTFVNESNDLLKYVLIQSSVLFFSNLSMWFYLPQYVKKIDFRRISLTKHIRPTIILFLPQIATSIYTILDKTMIGYLTGSEEEVAYYEQSQRIIKMSMSLATSLGVVMMPRIANLHKEGNNKEIKKHMNASFQFISFLTFPLCFGLIGISNNMVPWFFGEGFDRVIPNMIIIAPIIFIIGFSNVIGTQYLLPTGRQRNFTISVCTGTVVNLILNLILIPKLLSIGAAIATVIAELSVTSVQIYVTKNIFNFSQIIQHIYKYVLSSMLMMLVLIFLNLFLPANIICTFFEILLGVIVYFITLILLRDEIIINLLKKALK